MGNFDHGTTYTYTASRVVSVNDSSGNPNRREGAHTLTHSHTHTLTHSHTHTLTHSHTHTLTHPHTHTQARGRGHHMRRAVMRNAAGVPRSQETTPP